MGESERTVLGGEIIAEMLAKEGVKVVFGIVDGTYLGLYASFAKYGIRLVSPRHETTAAHMAGAYARLTGELGVCMASNGPGVANLLPGIAVENGEGNRVLVITSCRRQGIAYPDRGGTYQYFDQAGVTRAMTKWSGVAGSVERIPEALRRALRVSHRGRPGVVHLDVPENVLNGASPLPKGAIAEPAEYRRTEPIEPPAAQLARAAELLRAAERPLIHAGSGVVHARAFEALRRVAELLEAPVSTSWGARGALPETHPLALPLSALAAVDEARRQADLVLVVGSRLGETDFWGKAPYWARPGEQRVIQVDADEELLGLNRRAELAIHADAGAFLRALAPALAKRARGGWRDRIDALIVEAERELAPALANEAEPMATALVPHTLRRLLPDDAVLVVDGGNTAVWAQFYFAQRAPGCLLSTFKLGMLGAGPGQALGAQLARPGAPVVCLLGDGAMGFHLQEVETAVRHALPVKFVVVADRQWGMVKLTQQVGLAAARETLGVADEGTINADLGEIRFDDVARAMGAHGARVAKPGELEGTLRAALEHPGPAVVQVDVDPMLHLWAPGLMTFKAMHQEPEG
ncbi:MAG: thiamine pyrophosphate-binding protein [Sorangiineae bacterium]|nr:thiamine pyrophosphate-binding protein [Polyangiaceae bacterium]MEB2322809.1 thiamine pyrophosphate-binding protein [Sorangiineae bacterium]